MSLESEIAAEILADREAIKQRAVDRIVVNLVATAYEQMADDFRKRLAAALDEMVAKAAASIKASKFRDARGEEISFEEKVHEIMFRFLADSATEAESEKTAAERAAAPTPPL